MKAVGSGIWRSLAMVAIGSKYLAPGLVVPRRSSRPRMPPKPGKNPREQLRKGPTTHRVTLGDSREMPELADESVHLVVTSPLCEPQGLRTGESEPAWRHRRLRRVPGRTRQGMGGVLPSARTRRPHLLRRWGRQRGPGERRPPLCTASGFRHSRLGAATRLRTSAGDHLVQGREHQTGGLTIHVLPGKAEPARRHRQE